MIFKYETIYRDSPKGEGIHLYSHKELKSAIKVLIDWKKNTELWPVQVYREVAIIEIETGLDVMVLYLYPPTTA